MNDSNHNYDVFLAIFSILHNSTTLAAKIYTLDLVLKLVIQQL